MQITFSVNCSHVLYQQVPPPFGRMQRCTEIQGFWDPCQFLCILVVKGTALLAFITPLLCIFPLAFCSCMERALGK